MVAISALVHEAYLLRPSCHSAWLVLSMTFLPHPRPRLAVSCETTCHTAPPLVLLLHHHVYCGAVGGYVWTRALGDRPWDLRSSVMNVLKPFSVIPNGVRDVRLPRTHFVDLAVYMWWRINTRHRYLISQKKARKNVRNVFNVYLLSWFWGSRNKTWVPAGVTSTSTSPPWTWWRWLKVRSGKLRVTVVLKCRLTPRLLEVSICRCRSMWSTPPYGTATTDRASWSTRESVGEKRWAISCIRLKRMLCCLKSPMRAVILPWTLQGLSPSLIRASPALWPSGRWTSPHRWPQHCGLGLKSLWCESRVLCQLLQHTWSHSNPIPIWWNHRRCQYLCKVLGCQFWWQSTRTLRCLCRVQSAPNQPFFPTTRHCLINITSPSIRSSTG